MLGIFQCHGVLLVWMVVGQGPTVLVIGAGGGLMDTFLSPILSLSSSLSLGDGSILAEIFSQRAIKPKPSDKVVLIFIFLFSFTIAFDAGNSV